MKKFLVILAVLFCTQYGAWAEEYKSGDIVCVKSNLDNFLQNNQTEAQFRIYFDIGSNTSVGAYENCAAEYNAVTANLQNMSKDIKGVVLIASADKQKRREDFDNIDLAKRRFTYVRDNILPQNIDFRAYVAGEDDAKAFSSSADDQEERSVNIYIIWRSVSCDTVKENKTDIEAALAKCNITQSAELTRCLSGKNLTPTESETLLYFLTTDVLSKCAELKTVVDRTGLTVDAAAAKISKFLGSLDLTVWRDTEGSFNTARLASDSIAAVVLGTTGGIITSKLVKKNQIKKGFEDLNCSIGGQRIAAYGDEFSVGLQ